METLEKDGQLPVMNNSNQNLIQLKSLFIVFLDYSYQWCIKMHALTLMF